MMTVRTHVLPRSAAALIVTLVLSVTLAIAPGVTGAGLAQAAAPAPVGPVQTGLGDAGDGQKSIATLTNGNVVVVGPSGGRNSNTEQHALILRQDGTPLTNIPFPIQTTDSDGYNGHVVALTGGGFAVLWIGSLSPPMAPTSLLGRVFTNDGIPTTGAILLSGSAWVGANSVGQVPATSLPDGGLAAVWEDDATLRLETTAFNPDLSPRGPVSTSAPIGYQLAEPPITGLAGGGYVYLSQEGNTPYIFVFDANGALRAATPIERTLGLSDLVGLSDGSILGVATVVDPAGHPQIGFVRFDATGHQITQPAALSSSPNGILYPGESKGAALPGGGFVLTWSVYQQGLMVQTFSPAGQATEAPIVYDTDTYHDKAVPTGLSYDGFAVLWNGPAYGGVVKLFGGDPDAARVRAVQLAYQQILARPADTGALTYWADRLANGLPFSGFATALAASPEGRRRVITTDYQAVIGRTPDPNGLAYWADRLTSTNRPDLIEAELFSTDEAYQHAGATPDGLARAFYSSYLGRPGDPGGIQYWTNVLVRAGNTPQSHFAVGLGFQGSDENTGYRITSTPLAVCGHYPVTFAQLGDLITTYLATTRDPLFVVAETLTSVCRPDT